MAVVTLGSLFGLGLISVPKRTVGNAWNTTE